MIINEDAARLCGCADPADAVGKNFSQCGREGTIIGVSIKPGTANHLVVNYNR